MTVNLQALAIKSEVKVAMRYKNLIYVKEVYGFLICFDGDFEAIGLKNFTNFLLCLFNFLSCCIT